MATDYLTRAENRLAAIEVLVQRLHDVIGVLEENAQKLPKSIQPNIKKLSQISRSMRRDRELAYCGSEDLTPSEFYHQEDAKWVFSVCNK